MSCENCGGFIPTLGQSFSYSRKICHCCRTCHPLPVARNDMQYGWVCPRCRKVNAPSVTQCNCPIEISTT